MIQINKEKNKIVLSLVTQLDKEDVADLILDLQAWLMEEDINLKFVALNIKVENVRNVNMRNVKRP